MEKIKFVDLFAGIGGFHLALKQWNPELILANDIDSNCQKVYINNFKPNIFFGDIRKLDEKEMDNFDLLCAGFPCQPFSKGGHQKGFKDDRGTLFFEILRIIDHKKPKFILLENVGNLVTHDNGNTFKTIQNKLEKVGYLIPKNPLIVDAKNLGIPMYRKRIYIPGIYKENLNENYDDFDLFLKNVINNSKYESSFWFFVKKKRVTKKYYLNEYEIKVLNMWNDFYKNINLNVIGFPIWSEVFLDNQKYETKLEKFPNWKRKIIEKNLILFKNNHIFINNWLKKNNYFKWINNNSHKKFEWQAGKNIDSLWNGIIQFRPSGVRVKKADILSTLVAMNHPQIIGKYKRYITPEEIKLFQGFPLEFKLHKNDNIARKQLGNTITVDVAKVVLKGMFDFYEKSRTSK